MSKVIDSKKKENQQLIKNIQDAYKGTFESGPGRIVLEDLKKSLGHGQTVYTEKASNQDLSFHLGRQSVINQIVNILNSK